ncbi:MAG: hypothetical protein ABWX70_04785 [Hyphomicrobium sp.]
MILMFRLAPTFALSIFLACSLNGCSDEQQPQRHAEKRSGIGEAERADWLTRQDDVRPELWLIEHETKTGVNAHAADAGDIRNTLSHAATTFNESPRMIANRAVQLEAMLKDEGGNETAITLINRLSSAIAPGRIESFGAAGEKYYNMRKAGFTGEQAIDALFKRYGSRS